MDSAGSLIIWQWQWSRGDRLESAPTNQPNHEELKPYRSCPGRDYDWPEPAPGDKKSTLHRVPVHYNVQLSSYWPRPAPAKLRAMYEELRAKSES